MSRRLSNNSQRLCRHVVRRHTHAFSFFAAAPGATIRTCTLCFSFIDKMLKQLCTRPRIDPLYSSLIQKARLLVYFNIEINRRYSSFSPDIKMVYSQAPCLDY